ncbi:tripartite tricarboxylate transporter substrate binding protein [Hydrogenophaga sp.]|uniref:Bug family tripartite tricarboxylate transporter substrate binding protein n=1 Tax=Hydrogenophaga sp. TaxID=1904254 RepID=UPI00272243B6|nr:tripartite tricarboxylate transporter substrate binding protein [Hydrogenophaga sp.]MDO9435978.1 tripartite tricarboxylate transporter substrate binding protein [Hydrogenophaga sp.]
MKNLKLFFATLMALVASLSLIAPASAQQFPDRPIRIIVGFGPGGPTDVVARGIAESLRKQFTNASVIVENRPGASGLIAANLVRNGEGDGYRLFVGAAYVFHPLFDPNGFDALKDMALVSPLVQLDWLVCVPASIGVNNLQEFAKYVKDNPNKAFSGSVSATTSLLSSVLARKLGVSLTDVSYKTSEQVTLGLLGGEVQMGVNASSAFLPHIKSGKLKVISTYSPARIAYLPEARTALEQGVDINILNGYGLWAHKDTPRPVIERLNKAVRVALEEPQLRASFESNLLTPITLSSEQFWAEQRRLIDFYSEAVKHSPIQR